MDIAQRHMISIKIKWHFYREIFLKMRDIDCPRRNFVDFPKFIAGAAHHHHFGIDFHIGQPVGLRWNTVHHHPHRHQLLLHFFQPHIQG